ncbi:MAG: hypothetical protein KF891_13165 [Rhizobacter sp.]|nr:hypothetical protein [Rhizobacter sp.]
MSWVDGAGRRALCAALLATMAMLAGCGGGGSDGTTDGGAGGGTGGTGDVGGSGGSAGGGGTPTPSAYSATQRGEITGRVVLKYEELVAANPDPEAALQALRDWTARQPEFSEAGIADRSLWARFTDGRYFVYYINWSPVTWPEPPAPPPATPQELAAEAAHAARAAAPGAHRVQALADAPAGSTMEVAQSGDALFLKLAPEEFDYANGAIERMRSALRRRGWVTIAGSLSLEALKAAGPVGFLFMTTHAAAYGLPGAKQYAFMTDTEANDANELVYESDLIDGSIVYTRERNDMQRKIGIDWHRLGLPHYAATPKFIRKYMQLGPHSLAILAMCNAGTTANADMPQAFRDAHAGSVMVWDGFSNPIGYRTPETLVDRMTGANQRVQIDSGVYLEPPAVPNRAFARADVMRFLEQKGLLSQPGIGHPPATIHLVGDDFTLTNPVITHLQITGRDRLMVYGQFGKTGAVSVTVGGVEREVFRRADDGSSLELYLPPAAGDPPGTVGEVVVTVADRKSNPRQLVSWRGDIHLIHKTEGGYVEYVDDSIVHLHLRGDPHAVRDEVDGELKNNMRILSLSSDTRLDWQMTTPVACENCSVHSGHKEGLEPKYDVDPASPYPPDYSQVQINPMLASVDAVQGRLGFFGYIGPNQFGLAYPPGLDPVPEPLTTPDLTRVAVPWNPAVPSALYGAVPLGFGPGLNVPAGQLESFEDNGANHWSARHTVKWGTLNVWPVVDDRIGR